MLMSCGKISRVYFRFFITKRVFFLFLLFQPSIQPAIAKGIWRRYLSPAILKAFWKPLTGFFHSGAPR